MAKINIKNKKIIEAAKSVPAVAKQEHWVISFDKEEGALFYSPEKISDRAELHQITDEYALYLDKNFKPQGLMVECFENNFLKHHKSFRGWGKNLINRKVARKKGETAVFTKLLESAFIKEAGTKLARV